MAHQALQFPSCCTSAIQKKNRNPLRTRPTRSTVVGRVRSRWTLSSNPRARPEQELPESSCSMRLFFSKSCLLSFKAMCHVHLRDLLADVANVVHVQVVTGLCDLTTTAQNEKRATICHFYSTMHGCRFNRVRFAD